MGQALPLAKAGRWLLALAMFALVAGAALYAGTVQAHQDPEDCSANGVGISFTAFRADGTTPIIGGDTVQSGEEVKFETTLSFLPLPNCSFGGGSDGQVTITTPDGTENLVVAPGGVPHVHAGSPSFTTPQQSYIVSEADLDGGLLRARTDYTNGLSHTGGDTEFDSEGHDEANAGATRNLQFEDVALEVSKTADPAFDREFFWDIDKTVDVAEHTLEPGESGESVYTVTVTQTGSADTDHRVSGTITIHNPATFADATIESVTDAVDGIVATVDCGVAFPHTLPAGSTLDCTYEADLPDASTLTNTATVETSGDVDGGEDTAPVDFTGVDPTTVINETVTVEDTFAGALGAFSASEAVTYTRTFTCNEDEGTHDNTATIVETGQSADASVLVICEADFEGLTPGFWKNHTDLWITYDPSDTVGSVFDLPGFAADLSDDTLLDALNYSGGKGNIGMARNLLRAAVAALLNAEHPEVNYPMTSAEIIAEVNAALASEDRGTMEDLKDHLDANNNLGGGIDAHGNPL